ncbi:MAG: hypothetical protein GWP50_02205 [Proteobacteria bacterium]|nr:hypothetical protein [Pseudomonadota bacterium]
MALEEFEFFTLAAEEIRVTDSFILGASPLSRSEPTVLEEVANFWDRGFSCSVALSSESGGTCFIALSDLVVVATASLEI